MRLFFTTLLMGGALSGTALMTAEERKPEASDRAIVEKFLKDHVMDKTVVTSKTTYKLDENKMESDYEDHTTFNNFTESAQGFSFDMTIVSKETRYDLDKDGKRIGPGRDLSGTEVYRYELIERVSARKITGTCCILSMTTKAPSRSGASVLVTGVKVADGKLSWNETLPGYLDLVATKGTYKPGSWDSKNTFSLVGGKLRTEYDGQNFDVDPESLKRTPSKEKVPTFVAKEIEEKPGR